MSILKLKQLMLEQNWKAKDIATALNCTTETAYNKLSGRTSITIEEYELLLTRMGYIVRIEKE